MTKLPINLVVVAGMTFFSGLASANTIVQNFTFGPTTTDWNTTFTFNKFDASLGTLQSITFEETANITTSGTAQNTSASASTIKITVDTAATLSLLPGTSISALTADPTSPTQVFPGVAPGAVVIFGPHNALDSANATLTSAADLALYTGSGTFTLPAFTDSTITISFSNGGNGNVNIVTSAALNGTLTYTYAPGPEVPEPATLGLLGTALSIGGLIARRRRASAKASLK